MADRNNDGKKDPVLKEKNIQADKKNTVKKSDNGKKKLKDETRHTVAGIVLFALAVFFIIAGFNGGGIAGEFIKKILYGLFGVGYALIPIICGILGVRFMKGSQTNLTWVEWLGYILFLVGSLGLIDVASSPLHAAGYVGYGSAFLFLALFDTVGATLFLGAMLVIALIVLFDTRPTMTLFNSIYKKIKNQINTYIENQKKNRELKIYGNNTEALNEIEEQKQEAEEKETPKKVEKNIPVVAQTDEDIDIEKLLKKPLKKKMSSYVPPPLNLLEGDRGKPNVGDVKANANIIKRSLSNFGIEVEMDEVTIGPTVTRYAFKPAEGVKLSRIIGLQNDLSLALAAHPIRIEAPIPGKSLVGIEIPNKAKSIVGLLNLLMEDKFSKSEKPLTMALGRAINGNGHFGNMAKMPHMLVAGATGSGKSVTIHAIITSLLYRNGPEAMKFIMIDPKRVELTMYNKIPHLLTPVITDAKKAILSLKWAAKEMDRRYDLLQKESVRDIESYHKNVVDAYHASKKSKDDESEIPEPMPYIVIIIDELADIMQAYPRELESAIVRLAQMSRAVGIHLLLSTQRPSVNVITGLIKANVPARIALQVASQIDSRTILDGAGAEKLLGAGDMLFLSGDMPQSERLQSAFISENEVKAVVKWIIENNESSGFDEIVLAGGVSPDKTIFEASLEGDTSDDDELYEDARMTVIEAGKASTSYLQRKLGIGYARAARLIDILEERGIIGPGSGAKPRDVLIKPGNGIMDEVNTPSTQ